MSWDKVLSWFSPAQVGWKSAAKRLIVALMIVFATVSTVQGIIHLAGYTGLILFVVGGALTSVLPRNILLWYQYRSGMIEFSFSWAIWILLGKSLAIQATLLILAGNALVTLVRKYNLYWKKHISSTNNTLYEEICKSESLSFWVGEEKPLRADFVYDQTQEGYMGLRYLGWTLRNRNQPYDFFQRAQEDVVHQQQPKRKPLESLRAFRRRQDDWSDYQADVMRKQAYERKVESLKAALKATAASLEDHQPGTPQWTAAMRLMSNLTDQLNNTERN